MERERDESIEDFKEISLEELEELEEIIVPGNGSLSCCNV